MIEFFSHWVRYQLNEERIFYIETRTGGTTIHFRSEAFQTGTTLREWETILNRGHFYRCHEAYLVNLKQVIGYENGMLTLSNQVKLEVSRRKRSAFQNAYAAYRTERGR